MFKLKERPYNLLLLLAALILITSFFTYDLTFDIHFFDTYFIIAFMHMFLIIVMLLLLFWLLYLFTKQFLFSKALTRIHIILLLIATVLLVAIPFYANSYSSRLAKMSGSDYDVYGLNAVTLHNSVEKGVLVGILLLIVGFLTFIANLVLGLLKNRAKSNPR